MRWRTHHTFTGEEYARMIATGIIAEDDRVELICGEIITITPIGPNHASILNCFITRADRW